MKMLKEWWYVVALVVLIIILMVVFWDEIGFSPKKMSQNFKSFSEIKILGSFDKVTKQDSRAIRNTKEVKNLLLQAYKSSGETK